MLSKKRYILLAIAAFALIIFVSGPRVIAPTVSNNLSNLAAKSGVGLAIEDLRLGLTGSARRVRVWTRKIPATEFLELYIKPHPLKLLKGELSAQISGSLLGGLFNGTIGRQRGGFVLVAGALSRVNLSRHDLFRALPIDGGFLDLQLDSLNLGSRKLTVLGSFKLDELELIESITLPTIITGLPIPIEVPNFKLSSASAVIDVRDSRVQFSSVQLLSDLVRYKGQLSGILPMLSIVEAEGCIVLSEQGVKRFGSFMPFIGGRASSDPQTLRVTGSSLNRLKATVTNGCAPEML